MRYTCSNIWQSKPSGVHEPGYLHRSHPRRRQPGEECRVGFPLVAAVQSRPAFTGLHVDRQR